jgi:hypothetical protein
VLSESPADEAAVRLLAEAILGQSTQVVHPKRLQTRGWPAVLHVLPNVLRYLHYRTDAEGLIVVVDSDKSPLHRSDEPHESTTCECRRCQLREVALRTQVELQARFSRAAIKLATGLAVPSIEAWFRSAAAPMLTLPRLHGYNRFRRSHFRSPQRV